MEVWREPVRGSFPDPSFSSLSGLDLVRASMRGQIPIPPFVHLTGIVLTHVGPGTVTATMPASPWFRVQSGVIDPNMLIDVSLECAFYTTLPPNTIAEPVVTNVNYMRPVTVRSGTLIARARVVSSARSLTLIETMVEDVNGRLIALATAQARPIHIEAPPPPDFPLRPVDHPTYPTPDPHARPLADDDFTNEALWRDMDGMTLARAIADGEIPMAPFNRLLGVRGLDVEDGKARVALPLTEWLCDPSRRVTSGVIASLLQNTAMAASWTKLESGRVLRVVDLKVNFFGMLKADGLELLAEGTFLYRDGDQFIASAEAIHPSGDRAGFAIATGLAVETKGAGSPERAPNRTLATVLFTDIVGSTALAERHGDHRWQEKLQDHNDLVRKELRSHSGREIKTIGDSFLSTFESPARAIDCARAIRAALRSIGLEIYAGLHAGEVEFMPGDVGGIAVAIAKRVIDTAKPGEILASSTVKDLVVGSAFRFNDRGDHDLKGVPGPWRLFALED